jgi:adenosylmethionine-8-amino-7-oxononanoate aminotransferase
MMVRSPLNKNRQIVKMTEHFVFYRKLGQPLPTIVKGDGVWLFDDAGGRYLDACGGAMVTNIGHGVAEVGEAIGRQAQTLAYVNGTAFTNEPVEELAGVLAAKAPPGLDRVYFLSSGSEAVEAALKLARQYHVERGEPSRSIVIAQNPGYHGNTMLALSASARGHYKTMFGPWLTGVAMIDAPYPYRLQPDPGALERAILESGPGNVAAFIAEPVGGSSTGASVPPPDYFARVRSVCDRYGVLFICDEVLTGAGRTGRYFGIDHFRTADGGPVVPDIITMGKGLNGGYAPISALITSQRVVDTIASGSGGFLHAQTYSHHPLSAAAALAVQRYIDERDLVQRAATAGPRLGKRLAALAAEDSDGSHLIGDVRGIGMLWGVEFVADRATKEPFPRKRKLAEAIVSSARDNGLVLWPNIGHADGTNGDLVMVAPAFTIEDRDIDELIERFRTTLHQTARRMYDRTHA